MFSKAMCWPRDSFPAARSPTSSRLHHSGRAAPENAAHDFPDGQFLPECRYDQPAARLPATFVRDPEPSPLTLEVESATVPDTLAAWHGGVAAQPSPPPAGAPSVR